jgi:hypothetical protein
MTNFIHGTGFGRLLLAVLTLLALGAATTTPARAQSTQGEYVLLVGGCALQKWERYKEATHDIWWGNFVRAARVRVEQIQKEKGNVPITLLVYRPAYERRALEDGQPLISHIESVRDKYKVRLVWFSTQDQLVSYLNNGQDRRAWPIVNFEYYGHSNRACFLFDYSNYLANGSRCWLHENELKRLTKGIYSKDAFIKSWGCHTGESMSKMFRVATGRKMIGAIGKTDYANGHLRNWVPTLSGDQASWAD